jgi:hypothetical protein
VELNDLTDNRHASQTSSIFVVPSVYTWYDKEVTKLLQISPPTWWAFERVRSAGDVAPAFRIMAGDGSGHDP